MVDASGNALAAVVLAAGAGTRLLPLTRLLPKALCPVDNVALVDLATASVRRFTTSVAVNVHHHVDAMLAHLEGRVHVSWEKREALGTAGALGQLRDWIAGRDVLVRNADAFLTGDLDMLVAGWSGERCRLLVKRTTRAADFGDARYVGACLLPGATVASLAATPTGLYEVLWRDAWQRGELELVEAAGEAVDCGTPRDYLRANLIASGGRSVVASTAVVRGRLVRSVVWAGALVEEGEVLVDSIRAPGPLTVRAPQDLDLPEADGAGAFRAGP